MGTAAICQSVSDGEEEGIVPKARCGSTRVHLEKCLDPKEGRQHGSVIAIREDATGGIKVSGIHAEICSSEAEMFRCLSDGSVQRTTGATLMNEQSSRLEMAREEGKKGLKMTRLSEVINHDPRQAQLAAMQDEIEALREQLQRCSGASVLAIVGGPLPSNEEVIELSAKLEDPNGDLDDAIGQGRPTSPALPGSDDAGEAETTKPDLEEELISELTRSEHEWGLARKQYQVRMEELQVELEETQRQLDLVKARLQESEKLEEKARQAGEEEKRRLERRVSEQMEVLKRKQQEYSRLKARHELDEKSGSLVDPAARTRLEQRRMAVKEPIEPPRGSQLTVDGSKPAPPARQEAQAELQRNAQRKGSEGHSIMAHPVAQQYLRSTAQTGPGSLDAELERIPAEDGKELLRRYCEKLVKLRQREKQNFFNWVDFLVVCSSWTELFAAALPISPTFLRMLRLGKLLRALRVVKMSQVDTSGDGFIDIKEFERLLTHPQLQLWLHQLEIETTDLVGLFNMLDDGDAWSNGGNVGIHVVQREW
eukprot:Skav205520  [mRNA]  locus=scaffold231:321342:345750:- [translate_table: standard]